MENFLKIVKRASSFNRDLRVPDKSYLIDNNYVLSMYVASQRVLTQEKGRVHEKNIFTYSQVSIKQASSLNYFEEIFHPARSY